MSILIVLILNLYSILNHYSDFATFKLLSRQFVIVVFYPPLQLFGKNGWEPGINVISLLSVCWAIWSKTSEKRFTRESVSL